MLSYHGAHSKEYCCHATDWLEEIIGAYAAAGFQYLGVTEHLPSQSGYLYPEEAAFDASELAARFEKLMDSRKDLHRRYDCAFTDFRVGFETEYYGDNPLERIREMIARYEPEIVVASVHHVRNIPIDFSPDLFKKAVAECGDMHALFCDYYEQQYRLIELLAGYTTQFPIVVGHMDLVRLYQTQIEPSFTPGTEVWDRIIRNIRAAIVGGLVFEVNSRGIQNGVGPYPDKPVLEAIARLGGRITFGDDSHSKEDIGPSPETIMAVRQFFSTAVVFQSGTNEPYVKLHVPL